MKNTILVVGAAGYIGSVMLELLQEENYDVVAVDNLSTGYQDAVNKNIPFYISDCGDMDAMRKVFHRHDIDVVMHFAAFSLVEESVRDPQKYFKNNVAETINLIAVMRENNCNKFILSSTAAIFGEPQYTPIDEAHPTNPMNPYGLSKLTLERILHSYHESYAFQYNSFRYFNAAGASLSHGERHNPETHIIPLLLKAAQGEAAFTMFGDDYDTPDGSCIRDYIHVLDLARVHIKGINNLDVHPAACYNLGNGTGFSNKEVIAAVKGVSGVDFPVEIGPRRAGDPAVLVASSEKAQQELNWQTEYPDIIDIVTSAYQFHLENKEK
jgi:UDP-glucose 4-epimerase